MPSNTVDASTLAKRPEFEAVALDAGWALNRDDDWTEFGRDGWHIHVTWTERTLYPASLIVRDPHGGTAQSMSFLRDQWAIGGELLLQLKSPGPLRDPHVPLETSVTGLLQLFEQLDPDRKFSAGFIAEKLRDCLGVAS